MHNRFPFGNIMQQQRPAEFRAVPLAAINKRFLWFNRRYHEVVVGAESVVGNYVADA